MKKYGIRIDNQCFEYDQRESRAEVLKYLMMGTPIIKSLTGVPYKENENPLAFYERMTEDTEGKVICNKCREVFSEFDCPLRKHPIKWYGSEEWSTTKDYVCDKCLAEYKEEKLKDLAKKEPQND